MPAGRPTDYHADYPEQVRKLCLLGATDPEIADFFEVCVATVHNWKNNHPEFLDAIRAGKTQADAQIASKLYSRAEGARWEEQQAIKVKTGQYTEEVVTVSLQREAPPDTAAAIFWLKNRRRGDWMDISRQEHTGADGNPIQVEDAREPLSVIRARAAEKKE